MKISEMIAEVIEKGLYGNGPGKQRFLCLALYEHFGIDETQEAEKAIKERLDGFYTLVDYLKEKDKVYADLFIKLNDKWWWCSDECFAIKFDFWKEFIIELQAKGL